MNTNHQQLSARKLTTGISASFATTATTTLDSLVTANNQVSNGREPTITVLTSHTASSLDQQQQLINQRSKIKEFSNEFFRIIESDHFEFGVTSNVEKLVEKWLSKDLNITGLALQDIFYNNQRNQKVLIGILKTVSHLDPSLLSTTNRGIAMTALSLPYVEVRECAVRAYEYWGDPELLIDLEVRALAPAWLEEYKQTVIAEIRG